MATQAGPLNQAAISGSSTTTTGSVSQPATPLTLTSGTLRLRASSSTGTAEERHIQWAEDVVDNEGMGKKSSKVCCIYHKPRGPDDESSDESSDSDGEDSDGNDDGRARPVGGGRDRHGHNHGKGKRKPSPNAYEKMPKPASKKEQA
ncbi:hypothetical protein EJ06DRAFT_557632 [Trichodelitschia bisporula]|uniref:Type 1 phosphatases regulator n=1 Tax=Trichodelitschia bisporula TaxID=703511 RepID=A0A6G1HTT3_9PEZI|nr:hypothetical protein EJ06DRAFT_557632 [Trichodelitschia bisporula]